MSIDWSNIFKIKIANSNQSMQHHEVVKLLIVMKLLEKHRKEKNYIRIYTEFEIESKGKLRICDIFYENIKTKETYCFEIQKRITDSWSKETMDFYRDYERMFFKTCDYILVDLKELPTDINELDEKLEEFII